MSKDKKNILVLRFSAMGDVAMTAPLVYAFAKQFDDMEITVASRPFFAPIFQNLSNIKYFPIDFDNKYKGFTGIFKLFGDLRRHNFYAVADLHGVLRTRILRLLFRLSGIRVASINKGRKERRMITRRKNKHLVSLPSMFSRYHKVFLKLGFDIRYQSFESIFAWEKLRPEEKGDITGLKDCKWIGIAPFAKHKGKIYPIDKMEKVVAHFSDDPNVKVFLFGGGKAEREVLEQWENKYHDAVSLAGKLDLNGELDIINRLDVMISMDSANMHLASIVNTPVISVWGATHPFAGFYGWHQKEENAIQLNMPCRPCSIFGNKECFRGDYACLNDITPENVIEKIEEYLK